MLDYNKILEPYAELIHDSAEDLRIAFIEVVNNHADPKMLTDAVAKYKGVLQIINSSENIGLIINIGSFIILPFKLTGDIGRDVGQKKTKLPEN